MADTLMPWRRVLLGSVLSLRRFPDDRVMRDMMAAQGLCWPEVPNRFTGRGPWLAWRSPTEAWLLASKAGAGSALLDQFAPGSCPSAMAVDVSDAVVCFEIQGNGIKQLLPRLVDASAVPVLPGFVTRCRLSEVVVMLVHIEEERIWLVGERTVADHVEAWLAIASESLPLSGTA